MPPTDQPVCPKCGTLSTISGGGRSWICGSYMQANGELRQSPKCRELQLTAERDELSRKLGEAAGLLRKCVDAFDDAGFVTMLLEVNDWLAANDTASEGKETT